MEVGFGLRITRLAVQPSTWLYRCLMRVPRRPISRNMPEPICQTSYLDLGIFQHFDTTVCPSRSFRVDRAPTRITSPLKCSSLSFDALARSLDASKNM